MWLEMFCIFLFIFCENKFLREAFLCSVFTLALSGWGFLILGEHQLDLVTF